MASSQVSNSPRVSDASTASAGCADSAGSAALAAASAASAASLASASAVMSALSCTARSVVPFAARIGAEMVAASPTSTQSGAGHRMIDFGNGELGSHRAARFPPRLPGRVMHAKRVPAPMVRARRLEVGAAAMCTVPLHADDMAPTPDPGGALSGTLNALAAGGLARATVGMNPSRKRLAARSIASFFISACHIERICGRCWPSSSTLTEPSERFRKYSRITSRSARHSVLPVSGWTVAIVWSVLRKKATYFCGSKLPVHKSASSNHDQKNRSRSRLVLPAESLAQSSRAASKASFGGTDGSSASTSLRCITRYSPRSIELDPSVSVASHTCSSICSTSGSCSRRMRSRIASSE